MNNKVELDTEIIRAGAGSGKTTELVKRFICEIENLIRAGEPEPLAKFVAITFTRNAATQIKERIREKIIEHIQLAQSETEKRRFRRLIGKLAPAHIGTIDSFASSILRANAIASGLTPSFEILDPAIFESRFEEHFNSEMVRLVENDKEIGSLVARFDWVGIRNTMLKLRLCSARVEPVLNDLINSGDPVKRAIARLYFYLKERENPLLVSFSDVLNECKKLLTRNPKLFPFGFIFVDEFQDTDEVQWEIIKNIAMQTSSKLLIVGDEKQSIYCFRGSDYTVFKKAEEELQKEATPKTENWRSLKNILDFVNYVFKGSRIGGKEYKPLRYVRDERYLGNVELALIDPGDLDTESHRRVIANLIARRCYEGLKGEPEKRFRIVKDGAITEATPGDIAILVRKRNFLQALIPALRRVGVPFITYRGSGFLDTEEICDMLAFLRFVENPNDDISFLALLRSPLFGFSDDLLVIICSLEHDTLFEKFSFAQTLKEIDSSERERIKSVVDLLNSLIRDYRIFPPSQILMRFLESTYGWAIYSSLPDGAQKVENLKKLIMRVIEIEKEDFENLAQILEETGKGEPESAIEFENERAVRIMTIHSAKGLEFPVVILPMWNFESKGSQNNGAFLVDRDKIAFRYYDPQAREFVGADEQSEYQQLRENIKSRMYEEEERLVYVALTRARDCLSVFLDERFVTNNKPEKLPDVYAKMKELRGRDDGNGKIEITRYGKEAIESESTFEIEDPEDRLLHIKPSDKEPLVFDSGLLQIPPVISVSVTELTRVASGGYDRGEDEFQQQDREALQRGSLIHYILSIEPDDPIIFANNFARKEGFELTKSLINDLKRSLSNFRNSELFSIIKNTPRDNIFREYPFSLLRRGFAIHGKIDLLILGDSGATIVDFKSDKIGNDKLLLKSRIDDYSTQLIIYALAVIEAFRVDPVLTLFFTDNGSWVEIPADDIPQRVDRLLDLYREFLEKNR